MTAILKSLPGLVMLAVASLGLLYLPNIDDSPSTWLDPRSPSFFPLILSCGLLVIGAFIAVKPLFLDSFSELDAPAINNQMAIKGLVVFFLYWLCLPILGFVLASSIAMLSIGWLLKARCMVCLVLLSATFPIALNSIFWRVANVMLPQGLIL